MTLSTAEVGTKEQPIEAIELQRKKRVGRLVCSIAVVGAALRIALAFAMYPWIGDPTYSYSYRGLLLADGQWHAALMMWHLPGYPLLLGLLTKLSGGLLSPYVWGTIVSVLSYLALVVVIDRLVAPRSRWQATRIAVASFLALYETLFIYATGPLTEPPYLLILYTAVWLVDRERVGPARSTLMGGLLGFACMMRLEGIAPFLGLMLFVTVRTARGPGRFRTAASIAASAILGWLATFGWLLLFPDYLEACRKSQEFSFTIPPAHGMTGNLVRLAECAYHACTIWLPYALLLPYWALLAIGLTHPTRVVGKPSLHALLLAITVPSLVLVASSIMHKRTASFLLPAAGIWFGLGLEVVAVRLALDRMRWGLAVLLCAAVGFNLLQAARVLYHLRHSPPSSAPASYVAARLLSERAAVVGPVWAFGSEPEIYSFWGQPLHCSIWAGDKGYSPCYARNQNNPKGFVDDLGRGGFKYLTFVVAESQRSENPDIEPQPYGVFSGQPLQRDLSTLIQSPKANGIELLGARPADGALQVYVFRIMDR